MESVAYLAATAFLSPTVICWQPSLPSKLHCLVANSSCVSHSPTSQEAVEHSQPVLYCHVDTAQKTLMRLQASAGTSSTHQILRVQITMHKLRSGFCIIAAVITLAEMSWVPQQRTEALKKF